jgi:calcium-dependent protein kinase
MESGSIEQNPSILPSDFPSQKIPPNRTNGSYTYVQNVSIRHFGHFARIDSPGILLFLSSHISLFSSTIMGCVSSKADAPGERGLDKSDSVLGHGVYRKESRVRLFSSRTFDLKSHSQSHSLTHSGHKDVNKDYRLGKVLGRGQFGTTRLAEDQNRGQKFACKSIAKGKLSCKEDIEDVQREVQIMHHLKGHPNVTYLRGAYEDKQNVHLVMDLCGGGELFDAIIKRGKYSEKDAADLIRTIVSVVAHCHNMGVIHRDLKPENFLLQTAKDDSPVLCTDFGLSVFFKPGDRFKDVVGSAYYVAPEVLRRDYGPEADIWSCGVILYILLSGMPPFWGDTENDIFKCILRGRLDFQSQPWPSISGEAKACVARMLEMDPKKRATANEILADPWMKVNGCASDKPMDDAIVSRLNSFANMNRFKKEAMKVIASNMPMDEITGLRNLFESIDTDKSGTITAQELKEALARKGKTLKEEDAAKLLSMIDVDANGTIEYDEFLAATLSQHQLVKEENLRAAFKHFDTNGDGIISLEELNNAIGSGGLQVSKEEIQRVLTEVDKDGNGEIDYSEFVEMLTTLSQPAFKSKASVSRGDLNAYKAARSMMMG